ncbi:MAG: TolC family outer membrane protein [Rhodoferax sp.]|uniref:TolC family outer membrane protein n=1 Tax=Rhodoferax sp. TaxID=50421 RepID=UPI00261643C7|nr:TolC family outer membrane protein [Rhodoferax sp.]MDD2882230.1 TolC family outer membrane protein [Rhodoferax sp.]
MKHHIQHNKRVAHWLVAGSALLGLCLPVQAMDLLQVYLAAQKQDATLLAARASAAAERERLPQARSQMLPNISANLSRTDNHLESTTPNFLGQEQTTHTGYPSSNKTVSLRQPLYRPQLAAQYRQARAQVDDAEAALALEEQNLAVRVSSAYFEAMLTHDQLALVLAQQVAYTTQLDAARKALAAGSGTRTDIDDAQARIDMNVALEIEARQNVSYTLQQLQSLINQPIDKLATLNVKALTLTNPEPNQLDAWTARAEQSSPQIQSLKARVEIARQEVDKAKSGHYPTLDAVAQWQQSASENVTNTSNRYTNNSVGLQLNIPIFSGGYVNASIRQALASQDRAEQTLEVGRRDLGLRVYKEFRGMTENMPKIKALEQALRSADQLVLSSNKSFQAGSRTVLDILNAEQQRVVVLRDLAQARYMYLISKIRLLALVGGADDEAVVAVNLVLQN